MFDSMLVMRLAQFSYKLVIAIFVFALAVVCALVAERALARAGELRRLAPELTQFLARVAKIAIYLLGAVCALGTFGIDVTALVAGLGLTGFALGFALKDIVSNTLAGILVIIYRPFQQGDEIKVSSFEGTVEAIDLRYTTLDAKDCRHLVPNSMLFSNAVTIFHRAELADAEEPERG